MQCPECKGVSLVMTERQSIEVDYCPQCRGVWLNRGELDKMIERASLDRGGFEKHRECRGRYDDEYREKSQRRKKRGFLGELFD